MAIKVYHVAQTSPIWPNKGWEQGFLQNGYEYGYTDWQGWRRMWGEKSMLAKIIIEVEEMKPDFVFLQVQRPGVFDRAFIAEIQQTCPVINFNEDVRDSIQWMVDLGCDVNLMTNSYDVEWLNKKGCLAAYMLPPYDEAIYFKDSHKPTMSYGEIVFIGNKYSGSGLNFPNAEQRDEMVAKMEAAFPGRFKAYGRGYGPYLRPNEEAEAYRNCRIAIMHNNFTRPDYTSDRLIRALACGAVCVPHSTQINCIDTLHLLACAWGNIEHLISIVNELLGSRQTYNFTKIIQQREIEEHSPKAKIGCLTSALSNLGII